ncbi:TetR family transcriptional regulator [Mesorhizobium sp. LHD-90]|uniref:TetR/AcrR family transcriptional regulator n=1 Tax=Mesorhizobium sp. LHD-90 TaxID=3071414 RepID=UPI0027E15FF4|nr:TetR family transcriptional regulator [Mesorhizobium sp. LHD-90]MDQ6434098.1 TetR family transcriptional regulator [Mesorhizobium sp. LHD-90]
MPRSTRKAPANVVPAAHLPVRRRGRVRFDALLAATAELLGKQPMRDVSIYDIARKADVPAASAYHFFPTAQSAFIELARQYVARLREHVDRPLAGGGTVQLHGWPDLLRIRFDRAAAFYNSDPVARRLFLSGEVTSEIRKIDIENSRLAAQRVYDWLDRYVVMPPLSDRDMRFIVLIAIYDGIWMTSCAQHDRLTAAFCDEANKAAEAYCRTFLPADLPCRAPETAAGDS